jgi:hypothetical protein
MAANPGIASQVPDLSAETAGPVLTVPAAPLAFHVMAKATGGSATLTVSTAALSSWNASMRALDSGS